MMVISPLRASLPRPYPQQPRFNAKIKVFQAPTSESETASLPEEVRITGEKIVNALGKKGYQVTAETFLDVRVPVVEISDGRRANENGSTLVFEIKEDPLKKIIKETVRHFKHERRLGRANS